MKNIHFCIILGVACILGGCSKTVETSALEDSDLPWGRPADWETSMPIAPGVQY